ncbi:MAG: hypothetical protein H0U57_11260 [Tatlockia sp.]|nr:hypothetical protein [Tatlockia sp.]
MNKEEMKLSNMLKENKISESDYQMLMAALDNQSLCRKIENSLLINPFQKIAGIKALLLGLIVLILMSIVGSYSDVYIDGTFGYLFAENIKAIKPNFILLLYQNTVAILTLALLFFLISKLYKQKNLRIIDFLGTVALARFPILISLIFTFFDRYIEPDSYKMDYSKGIELHITLSSLLVNFIVMGALAWIIMTYLFAFKESSGLQDKKLWIGFATVMIVGELIALILTRWFLYV